MPIIIGIGEFYQNIFSFYKTQKIKHSTTTVHFLDVVKGKEMKLKTRNPMWFEYIINIDTK